MGDLLRSFSKSMWVTTKHTEKSYVGLWGQPLILEADIADFWDLEKAYLWKVLIGGGFSSTTMLSEVPPREV